MVNMRQVPEAIIGDIYTCVFKLSYKAKLKLKSHHPSGFANMCLSYATSRRIWQHEASNSHDVPGCAT